MIYNIEYLFTCLFAICIYKYLLKSLIHFLSFLLSYCWTLRIFVYLDSLLSNTSFANIFSQHVVCLFILLMAQKEGTSFLIPPSPTCQGPRVISRAFVSSHLFLLPGFISVSFLISPEAPILWRFISFPFHSAVFEPPHRIWTLLVLLCFSFKAPLVEASFV